MCVYLKSETLAWGKRNMDVYIENFRTVSTGVGAKCPKKTGQGGD